MPGVKQWSFRKDRIKEVNTFIFSGENQYFKEFAERIDEVEPRPYFLKVCSLVDHVGGFIKRNPSFLTSRLKDTVEANPKFAWVAHQVKKLETTAGIEIIVPTSVGGDIRGRDVEIVLMEAQLKAVDLYNKLLNSISAFDIREMSPKDKFGAIKDLAPLVKREKLWKPNNVNVFLQNRESAEKLEQSLLDYASGQTKEKKGND